MKFRRFFTYILDLLILIIIVNLISNFFNPNTENILKKLNLLNNMVVEQEISFKEYLVGYKPLFYSFEKENQIIVIINIIVTILLYIIIPLIQNGQTLAMKLTKIKIVNLNDIKPNLLDFIKRSLIINILAYLILSLIFINVLNVNLYFYVSYIFILLSILLVIISVFMILYRQDEKGLHDILTKTKVIRI